MVLWDGSPHRWFGLNHSPCCLMAAIDDATGAILAARFFPFEGTEGYLENLGSGLQYRNLGGSLQHLFHFPCLG